MKKAALVPFFSLILTASPLQAVIPTPKLVSLVPPTAQMVAGMNAPPRSGQLSSFLLITHSNTIDLNDFIALSGVDDSHFIDQLVMVASEGESGPFTEHSLLASGRFDRMRIYGIAHQSGGANAIEYRGMPVLAVQPFVRERDNFHDVRWLAVMDSNLALFGTMGLVREELDRYLAHSTTDPSLQQKLGQLRRDDATWCVATLPDHNNEIQAIFQILDSRFAGLLRAGDTIQFGVRYGKQVEFEYQVGMASRPAPEALEQALTEQNGPSVLPAAEWIRVDNGIHGVLKVSKARYQTWIAEARAK